jgi:hypothetical protein
MAIKQWLEPNVSNAIKLILEGGVKLVGLESHLGGRVWEYGKYKTHWQDGIFIDLQSPITPVKHSTEGTDSLLKHTQFADGLIEYVEKENLSLNLKGVECEGLHDEVHCLICDGGDKSEIERLHEFRSKHFLETLLHYYRGDSRGNMILNVGKNHCQHIEKWVTEEILDMIGKDALDFSYIRVSQDGPPSHPS